MPSHGLNYRRILIESEKSKCQLIVSLAIFTPAPSQPKEKVSRERKAAENADQS